MRAIFSSEGRIVNLMYEKKKKEKRNNTILYAFLTTTKGKEKHITKV